MKEFTIKDCEKKFENSIGEEKFKWFNQLCDMLKYRDKCRRDFEKMLIKNYGFKKGIDTLIIED